jgi:hypothetical protein
VSSLAGFNITYSLRRVQATPRFLRDTRGGTASRSLAVCLKILTCKAPKRSLGQFRISGCAASPASSNSNNARAASPEPVPVMPRGSPHNATVSIASGAGGGRERDDGRGEAGAAATVAEEAVVPPAPPVGAILVA